MTSRKARSKSSRGSACEDDWFEYRLEQHPEFLSRIQAARTALEAGRGIRIEDLPE